MHRQMVCEQGGHFVNTYIVENPILHLVHDDFNVALGDPRVHLHPKVIKLVPECVLHIEACQLNLLCLCLGIHSQLG